jgi:hypothetical protein
MTMRTATLCTALVLFATSVHADVSPAAMKESWQSDLKDNLALLKVHCPTVTITVPPPDFSKFTGWDTTPGSYCAGAVEGIRQVCVADSDGPSPYLAAVVKSVKSVACTTGGKAGPLSKASLSLDGTTLTYRMAPGQANVQDNTAEWLRIRLSDVEVDGLKPYQHWKKSGFASDVKDERARVKQLCGIEPEMAPDYKTMGKEWAYCGQGDELHSCPGYAPGGGCKAALSALATVCYESPALKAAAAKRVKSIACTYDGSKPRSGVFKDVPGGIALSPTTLTVHLGIDVANVDEAIAAFLRKNLR